MKMIKSKTIKKGIKIFTDLPPLRLIIGWGKKFIKWRYWKCALDTAVALSTIASMLLVFWTLKEMQIQRDRAYSPLIVIGDTRVHIDWNGITSDDGVSEHVDENPLVEDGDTVNPMMVSANARNIGVGVAKKIHITINIEKLLYEMVEDLNNNIQHESLRYKLLKDGEILYLSNGTESLGSSQIMYLDKLYLLPNAEESFIMVIPPLLTSLVREFYIEGLQELLENYSFIVNVSYQDIQEKEYTTEIRMFFEPFISAHGSDGSGYATYQIKSK